MIRQDQISQAALDYCRQYEKKQVQYRECCDARLYRWCQLGRLQPHTKHAGTGTCRHKKTTRAGRDRIRSASTQSPPYHQEHADHTCIYCVVLCNSLSDTSVCLSLLQLPHMGCSDSSSDRIDKFIRRHYVRFLCHHRIGRHFQRQRHALPSRINKS